MTSEARVAYLENFSFCFGRAMWSEKDKRHKIIFAFMQIKRTAHNDFSILETPICEFNIKIDNFDGRLKAKNNFINEFQSAIVSKNNCRPLVFLNDSHYDQFREVLSFFDLNLLYKSHSWNCITWGQLDSIASELSEIFDLITADSNPKRDIELVKHLMTSLLDVYKVASKAATESEETDLFEYKKDLKLNTEIQQHNDLIIYNVI